MLVVFQRRPEEERVRDDVVPNGEVVAVVLPAAGAAVPVFFPASDDMAMSKMPLPPDWPADVLPELAFDVEDFNRSARDVFPSLCPVRDWATRVQQASRQKKAGRAMRILMCRFLSGEGKPSTIVVPGYAPARGSRSVWFVLRRRGLYVGSVRVESERAGLCQPRQLFITIKITRKTRKSKPVFRKNLNSRKKHVD